VAGALLGLAYLFIIPPLQVPDEQAHFFRAAEVSSGAFVNAKATWVPQSYVELTERFRSGMRNIIGEVQPTTFRDLIRLARQTDSSPMQGVKNGNVTQYPPVAYFPAALAIRICRWIHASTLLTLYAGRLFSLAAYLTCCYFAMRWLPFGRLILVCLALTPMAIQQAASLSADAVTNGAAFLYCAYIIKLSSERKAPMPRGEYLGLIALALFLGLCKPTYWLVALLVIIPAGRFASRWAWAAGTGLAGAATLVTALAWQWINRGAFVRFLADREGDGISVGRNTELILHHPFLILSAVVRSFLHFGPELLGQFVGKLCWLDVPLPLWVTLTYSLVLFVACVSSSTTLVKGQRFLMAAMAVVTTVLLYFVMTRIDFPTVGLVNDTMQGRGVLNIVQGRYLIPIAPMMLFAIAGMRPMPESWKRIAFTFCWIGITSATALFLVHKTYFNDQAAEQILKRRASLGVFRQGQWSVVDALRLNRYEFQVSGEAPGDTPVAGDWNGDGIIKVGVYRKGIWILDTDSDRSIDERDPRVPFGGAPEDVPVVGDWNGDGRTKIGIYRGGVFVLDFNGNHRDSENLVFAFGGPGDTPVVGDWNGDGKDKIGIYRKGIWVLDFNGERSDRDTKIFPFGGLPGDVPVVGDWTGDGKIKIGIFHDGTWVLDSNHNFRSDPDEHVLMLGAKGDIPLVWPAPNRKK